MFLEYWEGGDISTLANDFKVDPINLDGISVLIAHYGSDGSYGGDAFVLFEKYGKLFEVNAGHCSCHGLEDQWEPEETTIQALSHRFAEGRCFEEFKEAMRSVIDQLEAKQ